MAIGVTFFVIAILVIAIWLIIEFKRLKHKLFAIMLIGLILFTYVSFTASLRGHDIDFKTITGITTAGKLYFSWLSGVFGNFKTITAYAFKQDWKNDNFNVTEEEESDKKSIWDKLK